MLAGIVLSLYLMFKLKKKESNTPFMVIGCIAAIVFGVATLFSEDVIEFFDWKLRRGTRDEIVSQVKQGTIVGGDLSEWYFPPISNSDNKIIIDKSSDTTVSVEFFINAGFLDHYSAFVYTNDPEKRKSIEGWISSAKRKGFAKLDTNWYRVNY